LWAKDTFIFLKELCCVQYKIPQYFYFFIQNWMVQPILEVWHLKLQWIMIFSFFEHIFCYRTLHWNYKKSSSFCNLHWNDLKQWFTSSLWWATSFLMKSLKNLKSWNECTLVAFLWSPNWIPTSSRDSIVNEV